MQNFSSMVCFYVIYGKPFKRSALEVFTRYKLRRFHRNSEIKSIMLQYIRHFYDEYIVKCITIIVVKFPVRPNLP